MTHIENIPHILQYGITHVNSENSNPNYIPIGDSGLISKREGFILPNNVSLGDYIPFYFGKRMPMLFVIQKNEFVSAQDIVYCITTVNAIMEHDIGFLFSNGHAVAEFTDFYHHTDVNSILDLIDKNAIDAKYWINATDLDLKRRKEAEFLVEEDVPVTAILGYAVYNEGAKQKLIDFGIEENKVVIKTDYYF